MKKIFIAVMMVLIQLSVVHADTKGHFKVADITIETKHAGAFVVHDQFNPRVQQVELVLSDTPADMKAAVAELSPHNQLINQPNLMNADYILLWIDSDGKVSMNAKAGGVQYIDKTESGLKAELKVNTKEKVAGRVYTPKPVKTQSGETYELDVTFDTAVEKRAAGQKLPAGGGDPGKALMAMGQAMTKNDLAKLNAFLTAEVIERLQPDYQSPDERLQSTVSILNAWLPKKNWKITGGELYGDDIAVLEVEGEMFENTDAMYLARLNKTPEGWKLSEATIVGMLPD